MIVAQCDVLVLGGGPAGLATAIQIRASLDAVVLVVDASDGSRERVGETVPPDVVTPLRHLGLAARFAKSGHLPCPGSVSIWGGALPGFNDFILNPLGHGWHLHRQRFEQLLADRACELGATVARRTRFIAATKEAGCHEVKLDGGHGAYRVRTRWVVDATGNNAKFARQQGAKRRVQDRLMATANFSKLHNGPFTLQTLLEATEQGWWYAARLPDDRVLTMLVSEPDDVRALAAEGFADWKAQLASTQLLAHHLAAIDLESETFSHVPISSSLLEPLGGAQWLAVGDAASSYDPISSLGIFNAMTDAADAAVHIVEALVSGSTSSGRYEERLRARFDDYLRNRAYLYGREKRWATSTFWSRRASASEFALADVDRNYRDDDGRPQQSNHSLPYSVASDPPRFAMPTEGLMPTSANPTLSISC